jgi:hypothetical protein
MTIMMTKYTKAALFMLMLAVLGVNGCSSGKSPTEVYKAFFVASQTGDLSGVKGTISKGSWAQLEIAAKEQGKTPDQLLKDQKVAAGELIPELRNERIQGETATLETRRAGLNTWLTVPFVREGGEWKIALDKNAQDLEAKPQ